ncbi:hypothetical protein LXL04_023581 [Taraxacum kok-saghyz]
MDGWHQQKSRRRSKEDQVSNMSQSIFVTNFPDSFSPKYLWESCDQYGKVSDVFITAARSKAGKRYAFVRFLKVDNLHLLVANLCTIWHGKLRLHANITKFPRGSKPTGNLRANNEGGNRYDHVKRNVEALKTNIRGAGMSYVSAVKGYSKNTIENDGESVLVLDDSCLNLNDQSLTLVGKVKEFGSLIKLPYVLIKEGFLDVIIRYMGGFWVSLEFKNVKAKDKFKKHMVLDYPSMDKVFSGG